jgi:hypothetical protein
VATISEVERNIRVIVSTYPEAFCFSYYGNNAGSGAFNESLGTIVGDMYFNGDVNTSIVSSGTIYNNTGSGGTQLASPPIFPTLNTAEYESLLLVASALPATSGPDYGLSLDGSNDYVLATGYKGITGTAARSIGVWINTSASGMIVNWGANSPGQRFGIRVNINQYGNNGALKAEVNSGYTTGTTDLRDGNWHYIVVTAASNISANQFNLYVDGALETVSSSMSQTMNTANSLDVSVGSYTGSSNFFNGNMDKFSIWNKQLTASEITALYNSGNGIYATSNSGNYTSSSNLVVYWKMNEGSGSTLTDLGGNNNGTINGATWGSSQPSSESTISGWDDIDDFNLYSVSEIPNYTAFGYSVKVHYVQSSSVFHTAITGPSDYKRVMVEINHKTLPALRDTFIVSPGL